MDDDAIRTPGRDPKPDAIARSASPTVFINYRHSDGGWAHLLHERLVRRFGGENVFLDTVNLKPGTQWLDELRARSSSCTAFIALIGPDWAATMVERSKAPEEDHARAEIERALRRDGPRIGPATDVLEIAASTTAHEPVSHRWRAGEPTHA